MVDDSPDASTVPSRLTASACAGAVCAGGRAAAGAPEAMSHTTSSPPPPPDASHRPHTLKHSVYTDD